MAGAVACSSDSPRCEGFCVSGVVSDHDAAAVDGGSGFDALTGSIINPDGSVCEDGCGVIANPDAGIMPSPDAAADVLNGIVPPPDGGLD